MPSDLQGLMLIRIMDRDKLSFFSVYWIDRIYAPEVVFYG